MGKPNFQKNNYSLYLNDSEKTIGYREQGDKVMASVNDLIDNRDYLPFFYKRLNAIGPNQFLELADAARKTGFKKGRRFVQLLNQAYQP